MLSDSVSVFCSDIYILKHFISDIKSIVIHGFVCMMSKFQGVSECLTHANVMHGLYVLY